MKASPTNVTVPCFLGSPWHLEQLTPLLDWSLRTMRLPEALDQIEANVDSHRKSARSPHHELGVVGTPTQLLAICCWLNRPLAKVKR